MDSSKVIPLRQRPARTRINIWLLCSTTITASVVGVFGMPLAQAQPNDNLGQLIAEKGLHHIPACAVCHGDKGEGNL